MAFKKGPARLSDAEVQAIRLRACKIHEIVAEKPLDLYELFKLAGGSDSMVSIAMPAKPEHVTE